MTGYQPSASIASRASHSSVTAAGDLVGPDRAAVDRTFDHLRLASVRTMAEIDLTDRTDDPDRPNGDADAATAREILTWETLRRRDTRPRDRDRERRFPARHRAGDRARRAHRRGRARVRAVGEELLRDERRVLHECRRAARRSRRVAADARRRRHPRDARADRRRRRRHRQDARARAQGDLRARRRSAYRGAVPQALVDHHARIRVVAHRALDQLSRGRARTRSSRSPTATPEPHPEWRVRSSSTPTAASTTRSRCGGR